MRCFSVYFLFSVVCVLFTQAQTLNDARELYKQGKFAQALPVLDSAYQAKPTDPQLNLLYGSSLYEMQRDSKKAEECLLFASSKKVQNAFIYLGQLYTEEYRFQEATDAFDKYEQLIKKNDQEALALLNNKKRIMERLQRMARNTEDVQVIDSVVMDKDDFLSAYSLTATCGDLRYFKDVFKSNSLVNSTVFTNERETEMYFARPDTSGVYSLFSMEKIGKEFANEKQMSANNFGLSGDLNYPFVMPDGLTIYFAAQDEESIGGYDLFASRYNMNTDTYLAPERMNMPFNSIHNDYMLVIDEEKGVGWFASDRFQPDGKVCVYVFIPNNKAKNIESDDIAYLSQRAKLSSIKATLVQGKDYSPILYLAHAPGVKTVKPVRDFNFVVKDRLTYHELRDFRNKRARDVYAKVIETKAELESLTRRLDQAREEYENASSQSKSSLVSDILRMEYSQQQMTASIPKLEMQARNQEISVLK